MIPRTYLNVKGVEIPVVDEKTYEEFKSTRQNNFHKIPNTSYYLFGRITNGDWLKMSGLEESGEIDMESDWRALGHDNKSLEKARKEGQFPVTYYPKKGQGNVRWIFWSEIKNMAFDNIRDTMKSQKLQGYNVRKCCFKNKKVAKRSTFPRLNIRKMF